jgi:hypothetical protein
LSKGDKVSFLENDSGYIGLDQYDLETSGADKLIKFKEIVRGQEPSAATDLTTKNYVDTTFSASAHPPVTVTDSSEIDFTLSGQNITASLKSGSISSSKLDSSVTTSLSLANTSMQIGGSNTLLSNDALYVSNNLFSDLIARGYTIYGSVYAGGDLYLGTTTDVTKGSIFLGGTTMEVNQALNSVGIRGTPGAGSPLRIVGLPTSPVGLSTGDVWNNLGILTIV